MKDMKKTIELIQRETDYAIKTLHFIRREDLNPDKGVHAEIYQAVTLDDVKLEIKISRNNFSINKGFFDAVVSALPLSSIKAEDDPKIRSRAKEADVPFSIALLTHNINDSNKAISILNQLKEFRENIEIDSYAEFDLLAVNPDRRIRMLGFLLEDAEELNSNLGYRNDEGSLALAKFLLSKKTHRLQEVDNTPQVNSKKKKKKKRRKK